MANLHALYFAAAWNKLLASRNDPRANHFADKVEETFSRDAALTAAYHALNGGKWDGMMAQVHMSYVIWNDPTQQTMPSVTRVAADTPADKRRAEVVFRDLSGDAAGPILLDVARFDRAFAQGGLAWSRIPDLGQRTAAIVVLPQGRPASEPGRGPRTEYDWSLPRTSDVRFLLHLSPTLDTRGSGGIRIGVQVDKGPIQSLLSKLTPAPNAALSPEQKAWVAAVIKNEHALELIVPALSAGRHTLTIWRIDDNAVLESIRIEPLGN